MGYESLVLIGSTAFGLSAFLTWRFHQPGSMLYILDHPNERSLHTHPTSRTGGLAIVAGTVLGMVMVVSVRGENVAGPVSLAVSALLVGGVSFADDRVGVSAMVRLAVHAIAAGVLIFGGFGLYYVSLLGRDMSLPGPIAAFVSVVLVVWMINLYNFMDGMDGFAGGMSVIGFGTFAWLGWSGGQPLFAGLNLVIASSSAGFLLFNFPPARIFMGDVGSSTLGFAAATMSLWAHRDGLFPLWISILLFSPFIADATVTLARRLLRGEKVWRAHKTHYYQRLVQLGWGHRKTVLWEYVLMLACAATAVGVARQSPSIQWSALGAWAAIYVLLALLVMRLDRHAAGAVQRRRD